jgi:hypothetical protein
MRDMVQRLRGANNRVVPVSVTGAGVPPTVQLTGAVPNDIRDPDVDDGGHLPPLPGTAVSASEAARDAAAAASARGHLMSNVMPIIGGSSNSAHRGVGGRRGLFRCVVCRHRVDACTRIYM